MVLSCATHDVIRSSMFNALENLNGGRGKMIIDNANSCVDVLLGKPVPGFSDSDMSASWETVCKWVYIMNNATLREPEGIGKRAHCHRMNQ